MRFWVWPVADATTVVREGSATVLNLGHSKLGGPAAALQAAQIAHASGIGLMVGIATAMGLHLAAALPHLATPPT